MSSIKNVVGDNWQALRPTIRERSACLFNNELLSDVNFVVKRRLVKMTIGAV